MLSALADQLVDILRQRGEAYSPGADRHAQAKMYAAIRAAVYEQIPEMPFAAQYYLDGLIFKVARAITAGCAGQWGEDTAVDFGGYSALLASIVRGVDPAEVVKPSGRELDAKFLVAGLVDHMFGRKNPTNAVPVAWHPESYTGEHC